MTDNTKATSLKLQAAKREVRKVFLGNFVYAEFMKNRVRLTTEDRRGRVFDTIMLDSEQFSNLLVAWRKTETLQAGCVNG